MRDNWVRAIGKQERKLKGLKENLMPNTLIRLSRFELRKDLTFLSYIIISRTAVPLCPLRKPDVVRESAKTGVVFEVKSYEIFIQLNEV